LDAIGTGWTFPVGVKNAGAAFVTSSLSGPYNYLVAAYPAGATIYIQFETNPVQTITIPTGNHTLTTMLTYFSGLQDGRATNYNNYLRITSNNDNAARSKITISAPSDVSAVGKRDGTVPLGLPKGETFGRGTGSISMTRNADPELVTENESLQELREALLVVMFTRPGERVMLRSYGVGLSDFMFKPINNQMLGMMKYKLVKGVSQWDKRILPRKMILNSAYDSAWLDVTYEGLTLQTEGTLSLPLPAK